MQEGTFSPFLTFIFIEIYSLALRNKEERGLKEVSMLDTEGVRRINFDCQCPYV